MKPIDRRSALRMGFAVAAGGLWLPAACGGGRGKVRGDAAPAPAPVTPAGVTGEPPAPYGIPPTRAADQTPTAAAGQVCAETEDNIEGPYYRRGAPMRADLAKGLPGTVLAISGKVTGVDCKPLAGAVLDVWHAD